MHRLFVAIRPPIPVRTQLIAIMGGVAGARWQDDAQLHLTLRFIGEVDRHRANDIASHLRAVRFSTFDIALSGIGTFERRGIVDSLWAGARPLPPLAALHHKVDRACVLAGQTPEQRAYVPHITLARFGRTGGMVAPFLACHGDFASVAFPVNSFALYESHLGRDRASYEPVELYRATDYPA